MSIAFTPRPSCLTEDLESTLKYPASSSEFDLMANTNDVLSDIGMTVADSGGRLSFYGKDPIISSPHRFGAMAAIGLAAKSVAAAALWRARTGEVQDIHVDVRKSLRRFYGFFEGKWETINGRPPAMGGFAGNPFLELPLVHKTRDGRYVVALDFYPRSKTDTLRILRCTDSLASVENAILQWRADDLEAAAALWLLSLGIFDKDAAATAGSSDEHIYVAPDLFTAETPLGTYQGMTDQVVMSRTKESYRTVLAPHGSSKPQWLRS